MKQGHSEGPNRYSAVRPFDDMTMQSQTLHHEALGMAVPKFRRASRNAQWSSPIRLSVPKILLLGRWIALSSSRNGWRVDQFGKDRCHLISLTVGLRYLIKIFRESGTVQPPFNDRVFDHPAHVTHGFDLSD